MSLQASPDGLSGVQRISGILPARGEYRRAWAAVVRRRPELFVPARRSWAVSWLVARGVSTDIARAAVSGYGKAVSVPAGLGLLSGWVLHRTGKRRSVVGCMITGARRCWSRRLDEADYRTAVQYFDGWQEVV